MLEREKRLTLQTKSGKESEKHAVEIKAMEERQRVMQFEIEFLKEQQKKLLHTLNSDLQEVEANISGGCEIELDDIALAIEQTEITISTSKAELDQIRNSNR